MKIVVICNNPFDPVWHHVDNLNHIEFPDIERVPAQGFQNKQLLPFFSESVDILIIVLGISFRGLRSVLRQVEGKHVRLKFAFSDAHARNIVKRYKKSTERLGTRK